MGYLREKGLGGLFVGDMASDGDEFALFDFFLESDGLFDRSVCACITVTAAAGGYHWSIKAGE